VAGSDVNTEAAEDDWQSIGVVPVALKPFGQFAQYNVKATGHVAKLRRDLDV
jgi:hypothetical protein